MVDQAEHSVNYSEMVDFKDLTGSALDRQMREFGYGSTNRALLEAQGLNSSALADAVAAASASIGSIRRSALEDAALGVTSRNEALSV